MPPSASTDEIRTAYRALALRLHPDRAAEANGPERALAERRMREINESWHVLRDPVRRRAYDQSRLTAAPGRSGASGASSPSAARRPAASPPARVDHGDDDLVEVMPPMSALTAGLFRHLPWVVLVVVFGVIFVLTAYAGGSRSDAPAAEPPTAEVGACVDVSDGPVTTIVDCEGPHELRIVDRVDEATPCPPGAERRRLADDGFLDCVVTT